MSTNSKALKILEDALAAFGCQTGTIHRSDSGHLLQLVCQIGVPEPLIDKISSIPFGKGIAGAAAQRREPVELCNLQQDLGGVAKENARRTGVAGSLAVPVFDPVTGEVIGTLGIGKFAPYDFSDEETRRLESMARELAQQFAHKPSAGG